VVVGGLELGDAVDDLDVEQAGCLIERDRLADGLVALVDLRVAQEHRRAEPGDEQIASTATVTPVTFARRLMPRHQVRRSFSSRARVRRPPSSPRDQAVLPAFSM
jgi:hypothetical protein